MLEIIRSILERKVWDALLLENASKKLNMSIDEIEKYEENVTNSLLYTIHMMAQVNSGNLDMLTKEGHVFVEE